MYIVAIDVAIMVHMEPLLPQTLLFQIILTQLTLSGVILCRMPFQGDVLDLSLTYPILMVVEQLYTLLVPALTITR